MSEISRRNVIRAVGTAGVVGVGMSLPKPVQSAEDNHAPDGALGNGHYGAVADQRTRRMTAWPDRPSGNSDDLSDIDEIAAAVAELEELPELVIYEHRNFGGRNARTNLDWRYVGDWWNDRISAIVIVRGRWRFYLHSNYRGPYWNLGPDYYPWVEDANIPNDVISSFRYIGG